MSAIIYNPERAKMSILISKDEIKALQSKEGMGRSINSVTYFTPEKIAEFEKYGVRRKTDLAVLKECLTASLNGNLYTPKQRAYLEEFLRKH